MQKPRRSNTMRFVLSRLKLVYLKMRRDTDGRGRCQRTPPHKMCCLTMKHFAGQKLRNLITGEVRNLICPPLLGEYCPRDAREHPER